MIPLNVNLGNPDTKSTRATKAKGDRTSETMLYDASNIVTTEIGDWGSHGDCLRCYLDAYHVN